jgi:hypothetical protein
MRNILKGSTDQSVVIRIVDETAGTAETSVVAATVGLDLKYRREGAATADLTESDLAALTTAHTDGGLKHIGAGYYRVDVPDAAFATGADGVLVFGTCTGMLVIGVYVPLVAYNPQDGVRQGMTALPDAAADAAGGLVISDAGGLDADAQRADVAAILVDTGTTLDGKVDSILDDTGTAGVVVDSLSAASVDAIHDEAVDGAITLRQSIRLLNSASGAKTSGMATTTAIIRDLADTKDRVTAVVDADGNRTAVVRDLT